MPPSPRRATCAWPTSPPCSPNRSWIRPTSPSRSTEAEGSGEGAEAGEQASDHQGVDLLGAFVGDDRFEVGHVAHDRILQRDAVRAEDPAAGPGDLQRLAGVVELAERHVLGSQSALV